MFRGSPNNVPQRKIGRDLHISPSTVQNIIKAFKESGICLQEEWDKITAETLHHLLSLMSQRL